MFFYEEPFAGALGEKLRGAVLHQNCVDSSHTVPVPPRRSFPADVDAFMLVYVKGKNNLNGFTGQRIICAARTESGSTAHTESGSSAVGMGWGSALHPNKLAGLFLDGRFILI